MPRQHWARVEQDLANVMSEIEASHGGRRPELLSGLAEGADRLAAFVALGRNWSLRAVLAFHRSRFEEDFPTPYAIGEFRALLNASQVVEEPGTKANIGKPTEDGYDAVAQRLLARADLLIAVWDGKGSRGRGGSVEVIEAAQKKRIPVIWIHARKAQLPRLLPPREPVPTLPRQVAIARRRIAARPR